MRKDFGKTPSEIAIKTMPEAGHSHYCDRCRTFTIQNIEIKQIKGLPALTMTCVRCGSTEVFRHTVDSWIPESVMETLEDFGADKIAAKAIELQPKLPMPEPEPESELESESMLDPDDSGCVSFDLGQKTLFFVCSILGLLVSWLAVFSKNYVGFVGVALVVYFQFIVCKKRAKNEVNDSPETPSLSLETQQAERLRLLLPSKYLQKPDTRLQTPNAAAATYIRKTQKLFTRGQR